MPYLLSKYPQRIKPYLYPLLFQLLVLIYNSSKRIEPLRHRLLSPLKRANRWMANYNRNTGKYKVLNYPDFVTIQTTWHCNLACQMCYREIIPPDKLAKMNRKFISIEDFRKIAEQVFPYATMVNLSEVSEGLLHPQLKEMIDIIAQYQCKLEIFTNGTPLTNPKLMDLILPHIGTIWLSIDGATQSTFEKIRKGAKFEPVLRAMERLGELRMQMPEPKFDYMINVTIQKDNVRELSDLVRLAAHVKANIIQGEHVWVWNTHMMDFSIVEDQDTYRKYYEEACKLAKEFGIKAILRAPLPTSNPLDPLTSSFLKKEKNKVKFLECPILLNRIQIDCDGTTIPCYHPTPPELPGNSIQNFWNVWNSPQANSIRYDYNNGNSHPSCKNCYLLRYDLQKDILGQ